jgi:hypothetical protein
MAKNRYEFVNIILNQTSERYFDSIIYPEIKKLENDIIVISRSTDRLDLLAKRYYGDETLYWIIAITNNIIGTLFIEPGIQLYIPNPDRLTEIFSQLKLLNL